MEFRDSQFCTLKQAQIKADLSLSHASRRATFCDRKKRGRGQWRLREGAGSTRRWEQKFMCVSISMFFCVSVYMGEGGGGRRVRKVGEGRFEGEGKARHRHPPSELVSTY